MRVTLINPPTSNMIPSILPESVEKHRGYNPPLGVLMLASSLRDTAGHEVQVIDAQARRLDAAACAAQARSFAPDAVGISAMTFTLLDSLKIAAAVKRAMPEVPVILGGPHPTIYPQETLADPNVDYVVVGEGERILPRLLEAMPDRAKLREIPSICFADGDEVVTTPPGDFIEDLDALPFPARNLVPVEDYTSILAMSRYCTTMFTSRGCPFKCTFCDRPSMGKNFRFRSPQNVVAEMGACVDLGVREFLIYDDTFTVDRQRVLDICDGIRGENLEVFWDVRAHAATVDYEMMVQMKRAGCDRIHFGVETGDPRLMRAYHKGITIPIVKRAFADARRAGLKTLAYFMIGAPGETEETFGRTMELALALKPDYIHFSILIPFPATSLYTKLVEEGFYPTDHWREFAANPDPGFTPPPVADTLSVEQLREMLQRAYRTYYRRPAYWLQRLRRIQSVSELWRQARLGVQIVTQ